MLIHTGKTILPNFSSPLDMLTACHDRIMDQCSTLHKLIHHLPAHGCDTQAQEAARAILTYFDTAGKFHHQDEEEDLFPLIRAANNPNADRLLQQLLDEHQSMDNMWADLSSRLQMIAEGKSADLDSQIVDDFTLAYGRHLMLENMKLLPYAAKILNETQIQNMGKNMAARRGVTLDQS